MKFSELNYGSVLTPDCETLFIKTEPIRNDTIYGNCIIMRSSNKHVNIHRGEVAYIADNTDVVEFKYSIELVGEDNEGK